MIKTLKKLFGITEAQMRGETEVMEPEATLTGWESQSANVPTPATRPDYNVIRELKPTAIGAAPDMLSLREQNEARRTQLMPLKRELLRLRREIISERDSAVIKSKQVRIQSLENTIRSM